MQDKTTTAPKIAVLFAMMYRYIEKKEALLSHNTALHLAAIRGHIGVTEILLTRQQTVCNLHKSFLATPPLHHAVYSGDLKLVEVFINHGVNPDVPCIRPPGHCEYTPKTDEILQAGGMVLN